MTTKISSTISKCIDGYVLEDKECRAKLDSPGWSVFPFSSCRKFKYEFCSVA